MQRDDESALRIILERYFDDVAMLAFGYVRTRDVAADIAQDVFVHLWSIRHGFEPKGGLLPFLRSAARLRSLETLRKTDRATRREHTVANDAAVLAPHIVNTGPASSETAEIDARVRDAVQGLSPRVREVVMLYYEQGLEPGEIASLLGVAPRTVYNQLRTGMATLADELVMFRDD